MPKKRQPTYTSFASSSSNPSTPPSSSLSGQHAENQTSVNDMLARLRREQAPKATPERTSQISAVLSSRTVPPHLRHLMNIPETAPPPPRPGVRIPRPRDRRVPGPAPPRSWLEGSGSIHAPVRTDLGEHNGRMRPRELRWISQRRERQMRRNGVLSLADTALKSMTVNWDFFIEYEQFNIATLPVTVKGDILTYLTVYGPDAGITLNSLKTIFLKDSELPNATGSEELNRLDLSGLVGYQFSLKELERYCTKDNPQDAIKVKEALQNFHVSTSTGQEHTGDMINHEDVAESWEDEVTYSTLPRSLHTFRFPNLTHLSLSHPGPSISWSHLLSFSTHLATLTHLSLAYWPTPSLTPNSKTTSVVASNTPSPINLGGTNFYSASDGDWDEAATVLKKLSNNTYSLRELDLEGCNWLPALVTSFSASTNPNLIPPPRPLQQHPPIQFNANTARRRDAWNEGPSQWDTNSNQARGPDWNGAWRLIDHVNVSQGWVPGDVEIIRSMPAGLIGCELLGWLRDVDGFEEESEEAREERRRQRERAAPVSFCQRPGVVRAWLDREKEARKVAQAIRRLRSGMKGAWCAFDHGWSPPGGQTRRSNGSGIT